MSQGVLRKKGRLLRDGLVNSSLFYIWTVIPAVLQFSSSNFTCTAAANLVNLHKMRLRAMVKSNSSAKLR